MSQQIEKLLEIAAGFNHDVKMVARRIIAKPEFEVWSGASKPFQHHYGKGGLAQHTLEVVNLCLETKRQMCGVLQNDTFVYPTYLVDEAELFFAALFHDAGKLHDYKPLDEKYEEWIGTDHKRMVHHVSRSGIMWSEAVSPFGYLAEKYHDKVLHAILAHHGRRESGSPVAPKTRVAWLLHHCDSISARMADADTLDVVKGETKSGC